MSLNTMIVRIIVLSAILIALVIWWTYYNSKKLRTTMHRIESTDEIRRKIEEDSVTDNNRSVESVVVDLDDANDEIDDEYVNDQIKAYSVKNRKNLNTIMQDMKDLRSRKQSKQN